MHPLALGSRRVLAAAVLAAAVAGSAAIAAPAHAHPHDEKPSHGKDAGKHWEKDAFRGQVDVVPGDGADEETVSGTVFEDRNENSKQDRREKGIEGVTVSNGRDVVTTDGDGAYELPAYENMSVFVTQPAGYQVPVDESNVAQFSYTHLPEGSPDDLSLYPQTRELANMLNGPARFLPGNHDLDFDATSSEHAFDTYRQNFGAEYYSYDVGNIHFVALSTVEYPLEGSTSYEAGIDDRQMEWLRNDIANTPENKLVVIAGHIALLDFADNDLAQHQVPQVKEIYELLDGREALALSGHTHSLENLQEGDAVAGWREVMGVEELPFQHITAGAISGDWYSGEMLEGGYPTALQRDGAVPGVVNLAIEGTEVRESFTIRGGDEEDQMALGLNSPSYREWFEENKDADGDAPGFEHPGTHTAEDLADTTWLTTSFWMGSTGATVEVELDGAEAEPAERTQEMAGEAVKIGAEWSDPAATQEQLVHGGSVADRSMHILRYELPTALEAGTHTAKVTATDRHGESFTETIEFAVED
ncbi:calcineurin-like phosphoesterase family protein [Brevibacterium samyangense]|uniref:Calcineurin-like phosphoesterase n=1 Tax=Brevibacterium samyangense TaxID=366888 RepID=A0ABN2TCW8_9MICO